MARRRLILVLGLFFLSLMLVLQGRLAGMEQAAAGGWITLRVSVASDGTQANDDSNYAAISADGRYVTFLSYASNLVPNDTNGVKDVFVHDLQTSQTARVSVASDGTQANFRSGDFEAPAISSDGRHITFVSIASNLVMTDTNNQQDIFVHDQQTGQTILVSVDSNGGQGNLWAAKPAISGDGRFVAFVTSSALVPGDTNGVADIFVHDRDFDEDGVFDERGEINTVRVSVASDGTQANGTSGYTDIGISSDGRHVSFDSYATNLVPNDTNGQRDTFVHDRDLDNDGVFDEPWAISTVRVSVASNGIEGNGESTDSEISGDGRYVTFWSRASNLVPGDTQSCPASNCYDVFIHDRDQDGNGIFDEPGNIWTELASVDSSEVQANNHSYFPAISEDSRFVAFYSLASNLVAGDTGWVDIFVRDRVFGETRRASVSNSLGQANGSSFMPDISGDGRRVVFDSVANNLVAGDTNNRYDIFVHDTVIAQATPTPTFTPSNTPTFTPTPSPTPTLTPPPQSDEGWQIQTLDVRGDTGSYAALALDDNGYAHIAYSAEEGLSTHLKYMRWDGVVWRTTTVDSSANVGDYVDIALDSNGYAHISYRDLTNGSLKYARWTGGAWNVQTVAQGPGLGFHSAIAIEPLSNLPHIVHVNFLQEELVHMEFNGVNWTYRVVTSGSGTGQHSDLVFDTGGALHLTYYDATGTSLAYASFDGANWSSQTVDTNGDVGLHSSLAFDNQDQPHISYYDASLYALKYAHHDGSQWNVEYVNINGQGGTYTSIALDSGGTPYISFHGPNDLQLAQENGVSWAITTIDSAGDVGMSSSLGLDAAGIPHMAYHDRSYGDLKYAYYGPHWEFRTVSIGGDERSPALALDKGWPGLTFHDAFPLPDQLTVASWDGLAWDSAYVDGAGLAGTPSSLIYDDSGLAHIAYITSGQQELKYATWDGASFQKQTVLQLSGSDTLGDQVVILLDESQRPLIVFTRSLSGVHSLWLAQWTGTTWGLYINLAAMPLGSESYIDAAITPGDGQPGGGTIYASYYEHSLGDLRLATWDEDAPNSQTDQLVDSGNGTDTGKYNRIAVDVQVENDAAADVISIAYYDSGTQNILYAFNEDGWVNTVAVFNTGPISSLDLVLGNDAWLTPYIAYTALNDNSLRLVHSEDGLASWPLDIILDSLPAAPDGVSIAFDYAPRLAFRDENGLIRYAFPGSRHNTGPAPAGIATGTGAILGFEGENCLYWSNNPGTTRPAGLLEGLLGGGALDDFSVMEGLTALFSATTPGQAYIDLYVAHANEMGRIGWTDPQLVWDGYRTLHNLMPGLEALVLGQGDQVVITQEMMDQALDIWQRIAAAGSPGLAGVINSELAKYNNLQDFVGMSFNDWAEDIGVPVYTESIYLPAVLRE